MTEYSEDALIEQPAIELFEKLGWETANCFYEVCGPNGTLDRELLKKAGFFIQETQRSIFDELNGVK